MNSQPNGEPHLERGYHLEPEAYVHGMQLEVEEVLLGCEPQAEPLRGRCWIEFFELPGEGRCLD